MAGTGLYAVKATPTHNDDTQSGAPAGQVITLVTGGLGVADAWKGGYVVNATRAETRSIVSHTDDTVTLEGSLAAWLDTDDLDLYDSWNTVQGAIDRLATDQGTTQYTAEQNVCIYAGTYAETVTLSVAMRPAPAYRLRIYANTGDSPVISGGGARNYGIHITGSVPFVWIDGLSISGTLSMAIYTASAHTWTSGIQMHNCTISNWGSSWAIYNVGIVEDTEIDGTTSGAHGIAASVIRRCNIHHWSGCAVNPPCPYYAQGGEARVESCTIHDLRDIGGIRGVAGYDNSGAHDRTVMMGFYNCTIYNVPHILALYYWDVRTDFWLNMCDCIVHTVGTSLIFLGWTTAGTVDVNSEHNCFYGITAYKTVHSGGGAIANFAAWQAAGYDLTSSEVDPLLTDPAAGDFSLQANSPCRHKGVGARTANGINVVDFDTYHPDVGAWSSGLVGGRAVGSAG